MHFDGHGRRAVLQSPGAPEFRLFIASTFSDMQAEREHLAKHVFPQLRSLGRERGVEFTDIDFRWGITPEEARQGRIVGICLDEINGHRPFFLGIIGTRYGWVPDPEEFASDPAVIERYPWLRHAVEQGQSLLEMEITEGALRNPAMADHAWFYFRDEAITPRGEEGESEEAQRRVGSLKERIRSSGFPVREAFATPEELGALVLEDMRAAFDRFFPKRDARSQLETERQAHEAFAQSRRRAYVERSALLDGLDRYAAADGPPLVVTGASGAGKSALLAYWSRLVRESGRAPFVIEHYVGAPSTSGDHHALLHRIAAEIKARFEVPDEIPTSEEAMVRDFPLWLAYVQEERLVLVIDAVNQLDEHSRDLAWLPEYFQPNVRLIISTTEGPALDATRSRGWEEIEVPPLTPGERHQLVRDFLATYGKAFSDNQLERVSADPVTANPLFLRTSLEELRQFGSYEELNARIGHYLESAGLDDLFQRVLARLETDYGASLVRDTMTALWAARRGLSEGELRDVLACAPSALACLLQALDFHLMRGNGLLTFFHDHMRHAVEQRYLPQELQREAHRSIARYFSAQPISPRKADELPWQLREAGDHAELARTLGDADIFRAYWNDEHKYELTGYWLAIGDAADAAEVYEAMVRDLSNAGTEARHLGDLARMVGSLFLTFARFDDAKATFERARRHFERVPATDGSTMIACLIDLGDLHISQGRYDEARSIFEAALARADESSDAQLTARTHDSLGGLFFSVKAYDDAEYHFRAALALHQASPLRRDVNIANSLDGLALVLFMRGDVDSGFAISKDVLATRRRIYGNQHPVVAETLNNLATILIGAGDCPTAVEMLTQAAAIYSKYLGPEHPEVANATMNLGFAHADMGDAVLAEECYRSAIAINRKALGEDHPSVARDLVTLASLLGREKRCEEAEQLSRLALEIRTNRLGALHRETIKTQINLAAVLASAGKMEEAEQGFRTYLPLGIELLGRDHPLTMRSFRFLLNMLRQNGRDVEAAELEAQFDISIDAEIRIPID